MGGDSGRDAVRATPARQQTPAATAGKEAAYSLRKFPKIYRIILFRTYIELPFQSQHDHGPKTIRHPPTDGRLYVEPETCHKRLQQQLLGPQLDDAEHRSERRARRARHDAAREGNAAPLPPVQTEELDLEKKDEQVAQAHKCCKVVLEHCGIQHMTVPLWTMAIACEGYFCERKKPRAPLREIDPEQLYRRHALGAVSGGWTRSGSAS